MNNHADLDTLVEKLSKKIEEQVKETVYVQTLHKDKEVSGLHREIRDDIANLAEIVQEMKTVVDNHDDFIKETRDIIRASGIIKKGIMWCIVFIPTVAAFVAGVLYLDKIFNKHSI